MAARQPTGTTPEYPAQPTGEPEEEPGEEREEKPGGEERQEPAAKSSPASLTWAGLRPLLLRLHFYAGILIGPFILVAAVTGLLYTAAPQAEHLLYRHELHVTPRGTPDALAQQVTAAKKSVPKGTVSYISPPPTPSDSTRVVFTQPGMAQGWNTTAFIDPYDHRVLGTLRTYGQWLPLRAWLDDLHRTLHLGDLGRNYSELAASWLWVEVLGGLALWLGTPRARRRLRRVLLPRTGRAGRVRTLSWHGAVGLWASAGLLGLSATGLTWSAHAGASIDQVQNALKGGTPAVSTAVHSPGNGIGIGNSNSGSGSEGGRPHGAGIDAVTRSAQRAGLRGLLEITPPTGPDSAYVVQENTRSWPERQDSVAVDPSDGKVTDTLRFADYPLLAKLTRWGVDAHMGLLFGLPNQIALALLALCLTGMVLWGYRMWWLRRPTRAAGPRAGRAPVRGAWRAVPGSVLAPAVLVLGVVGYYLPLFGLPLVLFLTVDLAVGAVRARRAGTAEATETTETAAVTGAAEVTR